MIYNPYCSTLPPWFPVEILDLGGQFFIPKGILWVRNVLWIVIAESLNLPNWILLSNCCYDFTEPLFNIKIIPCEIIS